MVVNGRRLDCPTHWQDKRFKTRHYQRIIKEWDQDKDLADRDYVKLFNILTDSNFATDSIDDQVRIESAVSWIVFENFRFSDTAPDTLTVNGRTANISKNLKQLSIGANIKARQALDKGLVLVDNKGKLTNCDCYSALVAIYLQPDLMPSDKGGFNSKKAIELEKIIADMPIHEIYPIGFFLLNRVLEYGQKQPKNYLQILISHVNKIRRMLRDLLKFSVSSPTKTSL